MDYVLRKALAGKDWGFTLKEEAVRSSNRSGSKRNCSSIYGAKNVASVKITDLDFADDIALFAESGNMAQDMLDAVEREAEIVGLIINREKTEYLMIGDWDSYPEFTLRIRSGEIVKVADFKYLGSLVVSSSVDFRKRKLLAWVALSKLWKIWKSREIGDQNKVNLFRATVEPVLLFGMETWTCTETFLQQIGSAYNRLLRAALNIDWKQKIRNADI